MSEAPLPHRETFARAAEAGSFTADVCGGEAGHRLPPYRLTPARVPADS